MNACGLNVPMWIEKNLREPWSAHALADKLSGDEADDWFAELERCFETRLDAKLRVRCLAAFFALPPAHTRGKLREPLLRLLGSVEASDRDEWVRVVAGILRENITGDAPGPFLAAALATATGSSGGGGGSGVTSGCDSGFDPYFLPLELAALDPALLGAVLRGRGGGLQGAFPNVHFSLAPGTRLADLTLERPPPPHAAAGPSSGAGTTAAAPGAKRPRSDSPLAARAPPAAVAPPTAAAAAATATALPVAVSERVRSVVGAHDNLLTEPICAAIERLLAAAAAAALPAAMAPSGVDEVKFKVHEAVVNGTRESIYIVLNWTTASWQKTRKTKKIG